MMNKEETYEGDDEQQLEDSDEKDSSMSIISQALEDEANDETIMEYSTHETSSISITSYNIVMDSKPHKKDDLRWEAIQSVRARDGALGLKHFRLRRRLGSGDIGTVYLAELIGTECCFAVKVMDKAYLASRKKLFRAQIEKEILQSLDHPFLPTLYSHFETDTFSCLVMEVCPGGDLHTLRHRQPGKCFPEQVVKFYIAEVLLGLEYPHMKGIIYRDLKPENILMREDGHIMLSDFDLSLRCDVSPTVVRSPLRPGLLLNKCWEQTCPTPED